MCHAASVRLQLLPHRLCRYRATRTTTMTESEPGPESLPEYRILDQDNVSEPETLLLVINDILERQRALETALALSIALTLLHLGEIAPPENGLDDHHHVAAWLPGDGVGCQHPPRFRRSDARSPRSSGMTLHGG
jgi:hypothetical protein